MACITVWGQSPRYGEQVYLHLDKPYYLAGDTIWFQGYVLETITHTLKSRSKLLHVALADHDGKGLMERIYQVNEGISEGYFVLPDSLDGQLYQLNAYTYLMKKQGNDSFFRLIFPIVNYATKLFVNDLNQQQDMPDFPDLKIANRILEADRINHLEIGIVKKSVDLVGDSIKLFLGDQLYMELAVEEQDLMRIPIIPQGEKLRVVYEYEDNRKESVIPVQKSIPIQLIQDSNSSKYILYITPPDRSNYDLEVQYYGQKLVNVSFEGKRLYKMDLPFVDLLPGRISLLLKNENGEQVFEDHFIHQNSSLKIDLQDSIFQLRSKHQITLESSDPNPIIGSLTIYKADDLSARVHASRDFDFFLDAASEYEDYDFAISTQDQRLILKSEFVTSGDTRSWRTVRQDTLRIEEDYLITDIEFETLQNAHNIFITLIGDHSNVYCEPFEASTHYSFYVPLEFLGSQFFVNTMSGYGLPENQSYLKFDTFSASKALYQSITPDAIQHIYQSASENSMIRATYFPNLSQSESSKISDLPSLIDPDYTEYMDEYITLNGLAEIDFEVMNDIKFRELEDRLTVYTEKKDPYTGETIGFHEHAALLLLNGVPVWDATSLMEMPFEAIDSIAVSHSAMDYFGQEVGGVVSIYTDDPVNHIRQYVGYSSHQLPELVTSKSVINTPEKNLPFVNERILWKPSIKFNRRLEMEFETPDIAGDYIVEFQGITAEGQPLTSLRKISVVE